MGVSLSILMPTYNGASFLNEQIRSILDQSFSDFELLIVDDGSIDRSRELAADFARKDQRVRILPSRNNRGQRHRLSELASAASGDMLAFADQDDVWKEDKIDKLLSSIGSAAMAFGRSELIDQDGVKQGRTLLDGLGIEPNSRDRLSALFHPMVSAHAAVMRRDALNLAALVNPVHPFDCLMGLDAMFSRGLVYVDDAVVYHRMHDANQSNRNIGVRLPTKRRVIRNVRTSLFSRLDERLYAWTVFDYLGQSQILASETRAAFQSAAQQCRRYWFLPARRLTMNDRLLQGFLMEALGPLAGSESDRLAFVTHMKFLCRSNFHPGNVAVQLRKLNRR